MNESPDTRAFELERALARLAASEQNTPDAGFEQRVVAASLPSLRSGAKPRLHLAGARPSVGHRPMLAPAWRVAAGIALLAAVTAAISGHRARQSSDQAAASLAARQTASDLEFFASLLDAGATVELTSLSQDSGRVLESIRDNWADSLGEESL